MHLRLLLLFMLVVPCAAEAQPAPRAYPDVTIPNTELRSLHSSVTGRDYDLYVYLPSRLEHSSGRKYPVLYLLDGQWDFKLLASIISQEGKHLGTIVTGQPTANCAFGDDGSTLCITANNQLKRVRLRTKGAGFA